MTWTPRYTKAPSDPPRCKQGGLTFVGGHMGNSDTCIHCGRGLAEGHYVPSAEVQAALHAKDGGPFCPDGSGRAYQGGDTDVCQHDGCRQPFGRHLTFADDSADDTYTIVPLDNIPRGIKLDAWMRFAEGFTKGYLAAARFEALETPLPEVAADYADKLLNEMLKREWQ